MKPLSSPIMMRTPAAMLLGFGEISKLSKMVKATDPARFFVVTDSFNATRVSALNLQLSEKQVGIVDPEPDLNCLNTVLKTVRMGQFETIIGFGGGSPMDCAKLVAVLLDNDLSLKDIAGKDNAPTRRCQLLQIPTTAGTGSEVGARALITDPESAIKIASESVHMIADAVIIDPELTVSAPLDVTLATGVDALAHCVEAFTSKIAHPLIDHYAHRGIELIGNYLPRVIENLEDREARCALSYAALYGGVCLGPVNTTSGHALAYPLGTRYKIPHGAANALIFPYTLAYNAPVAQEKTAIVMKALGLAATADEISIRKQTTELLSGYGLKTKLRDYDIPHEDLQGMAQEASTIRRLLDNNPRDIDIDDILTIYEAAY